MSNPIEDPDRVAILARRRRFIAIAFGGLSGIAGCCPETASKQPSAPGPSRANATVDTRESEPADEPTPSTVAEVCPREWDVESGDGSQPLSAKALRELAQQARAAGELQCALALLERAHAIDPLYHRLAFDIGELAFELDDCDKARVYLVHFTKYGDLDTSATQLDRAWEMLETIAARQCAHVRPEPELMPTVCLEVPIEAPEQDVGSKKSRCTKPRDRNSNRG